MSLRDVEQKKMLAQPDSTKDDAGRSPKLN